MRITRVIMAQRDDEQPSERSPLLPEQGQAVNGHAADAERQPADAEQDGTDEAVMAKEVSNKKLFAILSTTFIGVFFAALGKFAHRSALALSLTTSRQHNCCHVVGAHLFRVRLHVDPLVACDWLSYR